MIKPLFLILFAIAAADAADPVLDTSGSPVQPDTQYNVIFTTCSSSALSYNARNKTCPPAISVTADSRRRLPITVVSPSPVETINVNDNINLKFSSSSASPKISLCGEQSLVWRGNQDIYSNKTFITTGGQERSLNNSASSRSFFQIQSVGSEGKKNYKFAYCPRACRACIVPCYDIGIVKEGGERWLGIGDTAAPVQFEKVKSK